MAEMMESDRGLNQSLVEQPEWSPGRTPHIFPNFMGLEIASSVEKIYSSIKGIVHGVWAQVVEKQLKRTKDGESKTRHHTHEPESAQAVFFGRQTVNTLRLRRSDLRV